MVRPSPSVLHAWRLLLEAHRSLTSRLDAELRSETGFGLDWYDVLLHLHEADGSLRMSALAEATLFSRTDCTRLVDRMSRAGLVERRPVPEDRRGVNAVLTDQGMRALRRAAATHLAGIERSFGSKLDAADTEALVHVLQRLVGTGVC